jgi:hypothetical protein
MKNSEGVVFDPETIKLLRAVLDDAWSSLTPERQQTIQKEDLADRILLAAAAGERDPAQLRRRALMQPSINGSPPLDGHCLVARSALAREKM